jgi:hypothetical protein
MVIAPGGQILTSNPSALRILKIDDITKISRRHRYFKRLMSEDGKDIRLGDDPASTVVRTGKPILNLSTSVELSDGSIVWLLINCFPILKTAALPFLPFYCRSPIPPKSETQQQLKFMASFDALTGLPNRHQLNLRLTRALTDSQQKSNAWRYYFWISIVSNTSTTRQDMPPETACCAMLQNA